MTRISKITVIHEIEHYTITKRKTIPFMTMYASFMAETITEIQSYFTTHNLLPSSSPMVCFHNTDLDNLDVEIGYHIATPISCNDFEIKKIPTRRIIETMDLGPYELQDPTLLDMYAWLNTNHHPMDKEIYYYYINDPNRSKKEYLTKMVIPIKD